MKVLILKCLSTLLCLSIASSLNAQENTIGTIQISDDAFDGYTLFAPNLSDNTYLIDNCGKVVNLWESDGSPGLSAYLLPNGNLVRTRREGSDVFSAGGVGGGIEIFNWQGDRIWKFVLSNAQNVLHHDIAVLPNGNILAIAYDLVIRDEVLALGRALELTPVGGLWVDKIIEIQPLDNNDFEIVWEWNSKDHLVQDRNSNFPNFGNINAHPEKIDINYLANGTNPGSDWMHSNAIDYNPELDQIILNSRNFNEFYIIDHSTTTEEASSSSGGRYGRGGDLLYRWGNPESYKSGNESDRRLFGQHNAHWISDGSKDAGKIFVFNNGLGRPGGLKSSVDIIDPPILSDGTYQKEGGVAYGPTAADFTYGTMAGDADITSPRISGVCQLPNNNFLVAVGGDGKIMEFDENLNLVWEYVVPVSRGDVLTQGQDAFVNSIFRAQKYALDFPAFLNNEITVGEPIELNPNIAFCEGIVSVDENTFNKSAYEIVNTLAQNTLLIRSDIDIDVVIFDIVGGIQKTLHLVVGEQSVDISNLGDGAYYIQNISPRSPNFGAIRFMKIN